MATTDKTPLWLDLKKEYIDDNFNKLQTYLHDSAEKGSKDSFYTTTIELFRERINDLMRDISERPVFAEEQERQQLSSNVSMLATYLLADGDHTLALPAYVAFMNWLCRNPEWHISKTSNKVIYDEFRLSCPQNEDKMASIEQVFFNNQYWLRYLEEDE